jgi:hypothetical protein
MAGGRATLSSSGSSVNNATPSIVEPVHSGHVSALSTAAWPEALEPLPFPLEERHFSERPRLCVVIPAFNEEAVLEQTGRALTASLDALDVDWYDAFLKLSRSDRLVAPARMAVG